MNKILTALILLLVLSPMVSAELVFKVNDFVDLKRGCFDSGNFCDSTYSCNITISDAGGSAVVSNQLMTNQVSFHNLSFYPLSLGTHTTIMSCYNGTDAGADTFTFDITPDGRSGYLGYYFLIIIFSYGVMIFGIWKRDVTITILGTFALFFVGIWIMFNGLDTFKNYLTEGFSIITLGIAFYVGSKAAHEYITG